MNYLVTVLYHVLFTGFIRLRVSMHCLNKKDQNKSLKSEVKKTTSKRGTHNELTIVVCSTHYRELK